MLRETEKNEEDVFNCRDVPKEELLISESEDEKESGEGEADEKDTAEILQDVVKEEFLNSLIDTYVPICFIITEFNKQIKLILI